MLMEILKKTYDAISDKINLVYVGSDCYYWNWEAVNKTRII